MSENGVVVRPATVADLNGIVACSSALFAEDAGTHDLTLNLNWPAEHGLTRFSKALSDPDRLMLVADDGGRIVGHLTGTLFGPTTMRPVVVATLGSIYVRPTYRGRKVGVNLVEEFRAWARHHGAQYAGVTAYAGNEAAVRFYERNGFSMRSVVLETSL
ncbi:GNAT family N-acetyltransferase [Streptosporangium lutulentum]|uniref:GNAT superfamily N-acetyltransferase n=1 Tax=Streptosporangium lutulentum TaxID=1461250 RepID=A0ABT9QQM6_9ACTN|nr:GNAT family N-acetyltransferase [Streptosporangium lutulentum]MDP9849057.1 GNAT superfamily N-acetyltransferase [Streptosporangium lutulentum]